MSRSVCVQRARYTRPAHRLAKELAGNRYQLTVDSEHVMALIGGAERPRRPEKNHFCFNQPRRAREHNTLLVSATTIGINEKWFFL